MTHLLAAVLLGTGILAPRDSASTYPEPDPAEVRTAARSTYVFPSVYGSFGSYSTGTHSRSASAYLTLSEDWRDYYTLGFSSLRLDRDASGGKYYAQDVIAARAARFFGTRVAVAVHYAYLHEGEIASYSLPTDFHVAGAGASYWFSYNTVVGVSGTLAFSGGSIQSQTGRAVFSHHLGRGYWTTTMLTIGDTRWSTAVAALRQSLTIPLGGNHSLVASADLGKRVFYFDDELLVIYNQREIQSRFFQLRGFLHVAGQAYLLPSMEYDRFETYNVVYGSLGMRIVF